MNIFIDIRQSLIHGTGFILEACRSEGIKMTFNFRQSAEFSHDVSWLPVKVLYRVKASKLDDVRYSKKNSRRSIN
jgi:hypothetical protein